MVFLVGEHVHWIETESIQLNKNIGKYAFGMDFPDIGKLFNLFHVVL